LGRLLGQMALYGLAAAAAAPIVIVPIRGANGLIV
jgi:hypothetical protein